MNIEKNKSNCLAKLENINWNAAGFIGMAKIVECPNMLNLNTLPARIKLEESRELDAYQCFGISLLPEDRVSRAVELVNAAKRTLVKDSFDIFLDEATVAKFLKENGYDPYSKEVKFSTTYGSVKKHITKYLDPQDLKFLDIIDFLRGRVTHNNGNLKVKEKINFNEILYGLRININLDHGFIYYIRIQVETCFLISECIRKISEKFFDNILKDKKDRK